MHRHTHTTYLVSPQYIYARLAFMCNAEISFSMGCQIPTGEPGRPSYTDHYCDYRAAPLAGKWRKKANSLESPASLVYLCPHPDECLGKCWLSRRFVGSRPHTFISWKTVKCQGRELFIEGILNRCSVLWQRSEATRWKDKWIEWRTIHQI